MEEAIQETVEAYGEMYENRVGALMVFERETNLSNIISSGTPFQSTVTSELLKNIFYPNAPSMTAQWWSGRGRSRRRPACSPCRRV